MKFKVGDRVTAVSLTKKSKLSIEMTGDEWWKDDSDLVLGCTYTIIEIGTLKGWDYYKFKENNNYIKQLFVDDCFTKFRKLKLERVLKS